MMFNDLGRAILVAAALPMLHLPGSAVAAACHAEAAAATPVLVELFTSEGCDSCPPADRWLAGLSRFSAAVVIPLAFHVSYWDYLGWSDPYAQKAFDVRHDRQAFLGGGKKLYTPQVFVDGQELRDWRREGAFEERRQAVSSRAAEARLEAVWTQDPAGLRLQLRGNLPKGRAQLQWAIVESGLESSVVRGENAGKLLRHDHVVRVWRHAGEVRSGGFSFADEMAIPPLRGPENARLVAWLASEGPGGVRAALSAPLLCSATP